MATFELIRYGCGGLEGCQLECAGPGACRRRVDGDLAEAIRQARELTHYDPLDVIEIHQNGEPVCTVGQTWMSHRRPGGQPAAGLK